MGSIHSQCADGQYAEVLPDPSVNIQSWVHSYRAEASSKDNLALVLGMLEARYPYGAKIVRSAQAYDADCGRFWVERGMEIWGDNGFRFHELILTAGLVVHECGHGWDYDASTEHARRHTLFLSESYAPSVVRVDHDLPRTSIFSDIFSQHISNNAFDDTYIAPASPTGSTGFISTLDEWAQYNHSLAVAFAFNDYIQYTNAIDGVLTFMWYTQRYLYRLRRVRSPAYEALLSDDETRKAVLWLWGQSTQLLAVSLGMSHLGSNASAYVPDLLEVVQHPLLLQEIERFRVRDGCATELETR